MKRINLLFVAAMIAGIFVFAGSASAQETMMKKVGSTIKKDSVKVYKKGRRIGTTVGNKTWNGSKWVASKSWKGGKWVAIKTKNGTKWVYRKARHPRRTAKRAL